MSVSTNRTLARLWKRFTVMTDCVDAVKVVRNPVGWIPEFMRTAGKLLLLLMVTGCSPGYSYNQKLPDIGEVMISSKMPPETVDSIMMAVESWKTATAGKVALRVSIGDNSDGTTITPASLGGEIIGSTLQGEFPPLISLDLDAIHLESIGNGRSDAENTQSVAMHELGHALGLIEHEDHTLMQAYGYSGIEVDARTLERWRGIKW